MEEFSLVSLHISHRRHLVTQQSASNHLVKLTLPWDRIGSGSINWSGQSVPSRIKRRITNFPITGIQVIELRLISHPYPDIIELFVISHSQTLSGRNLASVFLWLGSHPELKRGNLKCQIEVGHKMREDIKVCVWSDLLLSNLSILMNLHLDFILNNLKIL